MQAEVITIGDEILIGQTIDTNSAWMAEELHLIGVELNRIVTISDKADEIVTSIDEAFARVDLILMTGGLGPTQDDVTKSTLANYFGTVLESNREVLDKITAYFESRGFAMLDVNRQQADLPKSAEVLMNARGTAMGMWFERDGKVLISMPGVPYEMKGIMRDHGLAKIKEIFKPQTMVHKTILTQGMGESFIADTMAEWETRLREEGLSLAYLPSPGMVKLRISGVPGTSGEEGMEQKIDSYFDEVRIAFPQNVYGKEKETMAQVLGELLRKQGSTLAVAESCTGGLLSQLITAIPGSSDYFMGGAVTYSDESKNRILGVNPDSIKARGAVSEDVVIQMANGSRKMFDSTYAIATSGIAGPGGGSERKPVGTIWMAIAGPNQVIAKKFIFGKNRSRNITVSAVTALNWLRNEIIEGVFE